ncbi:MAG: response regulator [Thermaceae bacterium]
MRVLIADDHPLFLLGLRAGLEAEGIEVVAEAKDGEEALARTLALQPDGVLLDLRMPRLDGLTCCRRLREAGYKGLIVLLTTYLEPALLLEAHQAGADGYFSKELSAPELKEKLRRLAQGEERPRPPELPRLTPREGEVLQLLAQGLSTKALRVSPETVREYLDNIYNKLEAKNRVEAVEKARALGFL